IRCGNAIKDGIAWPLGVVWITLFAGFNKSFGVAYCLVFDEDDYLLFRGSIEELAWHWLPHTIGCGSAWEWTEGSCWLRVGLTRLDQASNMSCDSNSPPGRSHFYRTS